MGTWRNRGASGGLAGASSKFESRPQKRKPPPRRQLGAVCDRRSHEIEAHRYSVPHALVGLALEARITDALVEVLHRGQRVACHARSERRGGLTTLDAHMPAAHRAHKEWTPERLIHWGAGIGPDTGRFVTQLLQRFRHPEHGYRNCLGLLSLAKRYGPPRVEAACTLALELGAGHYRHVRDILANGRDLVARPAPGPEWVSPAHENLRGAAHYH